jgi:hypothetical protein
MYESMTAEGQVSKSQKSKEKKNEEEKIITASYALGDTVWRFARESAKAR